MYLLSNKIQNRQVCCYTEASLQQLALSACMLMPAVLYGRLHTIIYVPGRCTSSRVCVCLCVCVSVCGCLCLCLGVWSPPSSTGQTTCVSHICLRICVHCLYLMRTLVARLSRFCVCSKLHECCHTGNTGIPSRSAGVAGVCPWPHQGPASLPHD